MTTWWSALSPAEQIFYAIGILSLAVIVVQTIATLVGLGGDAFGVSLEIDTPDGGQSSGIGVFSSQTIAAFFLGFGWAGVVASKLGSPGALSVFIAFSVGGMTMIGMYFLIVLLLSLQGHGNLDYTTAVGRAGEVYVTIPPSERGAGQIQVIVSGRLTTAAAKTRGSVALAPGESIRVVECNGSSFLVESLNLSPTSDLRS